MLKIWHDIRDGLSKSKKPADADAKTCSLALSLAPVNAQSRIDRIECMHSIFACSPPFLDVSFGYPHVSLLSPDMSFIMKAA